MIDRWTTKKLRLGLFGICHSDDIKNRPLQKLLPMLGLSALMSKRSLTAAKTVYLEGLSTHLSRKYSALPSPRLAMFKTTSSRDVRRISGFTNGVKLKRTICKRVLINVRWGFENLTSPDFQWSTFVPISNGVRFLNGFNSLDHYI